MKVKLTELNNYDDMEDLDYNTVLDAEQAETGVEILGSALNSAGAKGFDPDFSYHFCKGMFVEVGDVE